MLNLIYFIQYSFKRNDACEMDAPTNDDCKFGKKFIGFKAKIIHLLTDFIDYYETFANKNDKTQM